MTDSELALIRVSGALASGDEGALVDAYARARGLAEDSEVEEVILQSYLFLGFPAALDGMAAWRRLTGPRPDETTKVDYPLLWEDRGREVCGAVYAGKYERLRENVRELHPELERWMLVDGYGKVLGRPNLKLVIRELCIVATLAVTGASKQLYSHLRGALNVGAPPGDVEAALAEVERFLDDEARGAAVALWERVKAAE